MLIPAEFQTLFQKMLLGDAEGASAYQEYCSKRCQANLSQVGIDNSFLNYLSSQSTINQCPSDVLSLAAIIYHQSDGYTKPPKFVELLEQSSNLPLPAIHRAYLNLVSETLKENILNNIKQQSRILAAQNNAEAQCNLGVMYEDGRGISAEEMPNKDAMAVEWYRKAAAQGHARAQCNLGVMYANGQGISAEEMPNKDAMAVEWCRKAAAQGHVRAQSNLGFMYEDGRGISAEEMPNKDAMAVEWYRKAAAQGDVYAQCNLGFMYANGRGISTEEMPNKDAMAVEWYRKAAAQGCARAQCNLGLMYENGRGISENEKPDKEAIAYFWYNKSAEAGVAQAKANLSKLVVSPYQLKKAKMMIARGLNYQQVNYLFKERVFRSFLLLGLVIKDRDNQSSRPTLLKRLPSDLLFKIAEQLAPLSTEDTRDLYNKLFPALLKELRFKASYKEASNGISLFFRVNPIATSVKSGAPLPESEVEKYAKKFPDSVEAQVYHHLKNKK